MASMDEGNHRDSAAGASAITLRTIGALRSTLRAIDGSRLLVGPIEALDGTPVVDVKPVI